MRPFEQRAKDIIEKIALQHKIILNSYERYAQRPNTITGLYDLERVEKRSEALQAQLKKLEQLIEKEAAK